MQLWKNLSVFLILGFPSVVFAKDYHTKFNRQFGKQQLSAKTESKKVCTQFDGTWKGTCVVSSGVDDVEIFEESMSIEQFHCSGLLINGEFHGIGEARSTSVTRVSNGDYAGRNAGYSGVTHLDWDATLTNLEFKTSMFDYGGPAASVILQTEQYRITRTDRSMAVNSIVADEQGISYNCKFDLQ